MWGTPETRHSVDRVRRPADRHAGRRARPPGRRGRRAHRFRPDVIKREAVSRYLDVGADVSGRDRGDVVERRRGAASRRSHFPLEYHAEVLADDVAAQSAAAWSRSAWRPRSGSSCSCRRSSAAGGWRLFVTWRCRWRCRGGLLAALADRRDALVRLVRRASSRCSASPPGSVHPDRPLPRRSRAAGARARSGARPARRRASGSCRSW